ncbi:hypothetical protein PT974_03430 [Cladobotryum mycophilum]|uniref:DSBA-like thioredoxin domain-containing protein n=1 Tax=Cladobotryum mycophilum TaxID=491253 RepID=A0ABR0SSA1_9HYPO
MDVYVDLVCPWCFIEKHSLESLIRRYRTQHPEIQFDVRWRPFYIVSGLKKGTDKRGMYERVRAPYPDFLNRIQTAGSKHDIAFSIRGSTGSTRQGHKLMALALQRLGAAGQARVVEALYQGHFEDGRDVSDEAWLVQVGVQAGLPEEVVRLEMEDEDASRRVDAEAEMAREVRGVEAVPCVMVQGKYKVGGFQEGHVFEGLFDKIRLAGEF